MTDADLTIMQAVAHPDVPSDIVLAEARLRVAQLAGDVAALDALIAPKILFTGPDGQLGTKEADLAAHAAGAVRFREHVPEELHARAVGQEVTITSLRARLVVAVGGDVVRAVYRYTRVWARSAGGDWQVVGGHVSSVPGSTPGRQQ